MRFVLCTIKLSPNMNEIAQCERHFPNDWKGEAALAQWAISWVAAWERGLISIDM